MRRNRSYREKMFIKAWRLNLCAGIPEYGKRFTMQQSFCNALAYYLWVCSVGGPSNFAQADMAAPRVDTSLNPDRAGHIDRQIDKNAAFARLISQSGIIITPTVAAAIKGYFDSNENRHIVGKPLAAGRIGEPAANVAFVAVVGVIAGQLDAVFQREPPDSEYRTGLVSADKFDLFAEVPKERLKKVTAA